MTQFPGFHRSLGLVTMVVGAVVLAAWGFDASSLTTLLPWLSLKPATAASFILAGIALWDLPGDGSEASPGGVRLLSLTSAVLAGLLGLLALAERSGNLNFATELLLGYGALQPGESTASGLMSPATGVGFALSGSALVLIQARRFAVSQGLLLVVIALFALQVLGSAYGAAGTFFGAPGTALLFILLSWGGLTATGRSGFMPIVMGAGLGTQTLRRLLPLTLLVLVPLGVFRAWGESRGLFDSGVGTAGLVLTAVIVLGIGLLHEAVLLNRIEGERDQFFSLGVDLFCIADFTGRFLRVNPRFSQVLGWSDEELLARPFLDFVHPDDLAATMAEMDSLADGALTLHFRNRYRCKDGSWRWFSWTAAPVVSAGRIFATARDITELYTIEEALRLSEENLAVTLHSIGDGVLTTDAQGRVTGLNPAAERLTGWGEAEVTERPVGEVFRVINEQTRQPVVVPVDEVLRTGATQGLANHSVLIARDGSERPVADSAAPIRNRDGQLIGVVLVFRDVTAERAAARAMERMNATLEERVAQRTADLEKSELRFEHLFEFAPDGMVMVDAEGKIARVNRQTEQLFGWPRADLIGQPIEVLVPASARARHPALREHYTANASPRAMGESQAELLAVRRDGTEFPVNISLSPVEAEEGCYVVASVRDVTDRHHLEAKLRQGQKMEAIGQLAGGVAHDFNNLLTVINGYAEMLSSQLPPDGPSRTAVGEIEAAGQRAAELTRQLLAFGRRQALKPRIVDPNEVVHKATNMLRRVIGEDVRLHVTLGPVSQILVDPGQLEQVVMNLAVNARDAMPEGGQLTIETRAVEFDGAYAASHPEVRPGSWVMVAVSDTGSGMDERTRNQAFDPFFTTKAVGKGTGLGLSTVHGVVHQSGGHIWLYSELGKGTTFKIYFPVAEGARTAHDPATVVSPPHGEETILLVEDERAVRVVTRLALEALGYQVIEASGAPEAIEHIKNKSDSTPFRLLLTDVIMPGMGGRELAQEVQRIRPEIKVLFMSGYTDDAIVRHGVLSDEMALLQKPYTALTLAVKVREVLDR